MAETRRARAKRATFRSHDGRLLQPIRTVRVYGLFGKYDFDRIDLYGRDTETPDVSFLYGENGVGKTTLLKLIYASLSQESRGGLRSQIANTPFARFDVEFLDGHIVSAVREEAVRGGYRYIIDGPSVSDTFDVKVGERGSVTVEENPGIEEFVAKIGDFCPNIVYVSDQRTIRSSFEPWDIRRHLSDKISRRRGYIYDDGEPVLDTDLDTLINSGLDRLLDQVRALFRDLALSSNTEASQSAGQIYLDIIQKISGEGGGRGGQTLESFEALMGRIEVLLEMMPHYEDLGLVEGQPIDKLLTTLKNTPEGRRAHILEVTEPYISTLEKRLESHRQLKDMMSAFQGSVNSFLNRKRLISKLNRPVLIEDDGGRPIQTSELSSGERHILYISGAALLSRVQPSIILVDEPELSLNYKWQRMLVSSLRRLAEGSAQFVMATHSFEIISKYRDAAVELEPLR